MVSVATMGGPPNPALAYHEYLGPAIFEPMARVTLAVAKPQLGERVLDVACGSGIVTTQLPALVGAAGRVVGLDINPKMLEVAADGSSDVEWKQGNGMAMDVPSAAFDLVICQHGLQFFPDRAAGAREMRRVLERGGRAVVTCWQGLAEQTFFASLVRAQARQLGVDEAQVATPFSFGDAEALRALLVEAGFTRVDIETHTIESQFPQPERFLKMTVSAAAAVMPEKFAHVDPEPLVAAIAAECSEELARYRVGDTLRFPMPANVAIAFA